MKDLSSLKKKLVAYSALTAGVMALASEKSDGQIIYTDINPDQHITGDDNLIDLNNDGIVDFKFETSSYWYASTYVFEYSASATLSVIPYGNNRIVGTGTKAAAIPSGNLITQNSPGLEGNALMVWSWSHIQYFSSTGSYYNSTTNYNGNWHNTVDHFLGFSLVVNGDTLCGWMRLDVSLLNGPTVLKDYAYNIFPGNSIAAGDSTNNSCNQLATIIPGIAYCDSQVVTVNEIPGFQIQWFNGSDPIPGATDSAYTVYFSGNYSVMLFTDSCSTLSQPTPIVIYSNLYPPINRVADTLSSGSYYSYQWYLDGSPIPGATDPSYVITEDGTYGLIATGANGCSSNFTFSDETICSELLDPQIIPYPPPAVICSGVPVTLLELPYYTGSYQWYINGSPIAGATSYVYYNIDSAGSYFITVKNSIGCMESSNTITIVADNNPTTPTITRMQDTLQSTFNFSYQWYNAGISINGAISQFYEMGQSGTYVVVVADSLGCTASSLPYPALSCDALAIAGIAGAATQEICFGDSLTLMNTHTDSTYQWLINGNIIPGAVQQSITIDTGGIYSVIVSGEYGCTNTDFVTILQPVVPFITLFSDSVLYSSSFVNNQWYFNGNPIPGATGSHYVPQQGGIYQVLVTDAYGCTALSQPYNFIPTNVNDAVGADLFNAFIENKQLIIQLHQSPLPSRIIFFNAVGIKLREQTITQSEVVMDVSRLAAGIYFVAVVDVDEKRRVKKVVIE